MLQCVVWVRWFPLCRLPCHHLLGDVATAAVAAGGDRVEISQFGCGSPVDTKRRTHRILAVLIVQLTIALIQQ